MKAKISEALQHLNDMYAVGHIRDEGNNKFQAARQLLEEALVMPEPEAQTVDSLDVAEVKNSLGDITTRLNATSSQQASDMVAINEKLEAIELHVATLAGQVEPTPA